MTPAPTPVWEFTEDQWAAIDRAIIKVYINTRTILPTHWQDTSTRDPAAALRSWAYEYAATHPADITSREPWQITHHVRGRLQQALSRDIRRTAELPYSIGQDFYQRITQTDEEAAEKAAPDGTRTPRRYAPRYWQNKSPLETDAKLDMIDRYGRFIPDDQQQFSIKGHRNGAPIYEHPAIMNKLHTRKPTRTEFWNQVCTEPHRKQFRDQLAQTFNDGICNCPECEQYAKNRGWKN